MSSRRAFVAGLCASLLALSPDALAQEKGRVWRVGFLSSRGRPASPELDYHVGFPRGLRELGYVEGKSIVIEWRFADGKYERFPDLLAELIRIPVDVIVTDGTPTTLAAQKSTRTIPIVFGSAADPVGNGLVRSLARPGANTTGISLLGTEAAVKQIEMLVSTVPKLSRIGVLFNPDNPSAAQIMRGLQGTPELAKLTLLPLAVRTREAIEDAFPLMVRERAGAVVYLPDSFLAELRPLMVELALKHRIPGAAAGIGFSAAGGLMSYGQNLENNYRRAATYVDKILKGAKPGDLPVEQPTKFDLVLNRKTAKALGLEFPPELLLLADKVIE